ncbi:MAG: hypothetical protein M3Q45_04025, partial [Chloroflexota bacterium]|nr:hypothetical protein [Chloroflexota bacterium]
PHQPAQASLTVQSAGGQTANSRLQVTVVRSITGPLHLPDALAGLTVQDSIIEAPARNGPASVAPALVSGNLSSFPTFVATLPQVQVTLGDDGPYLATLDSAPATLAPARDRLQAALRAAHGSPAFIDAHVLSADNRLIVLPGTPDIVEIGTVEIDNGAVDDSASRLRLTPSVSQSVLALRSGALMPFPIFGLTSPSLMLTLGAETHEITLATPPLSLAQARSGLQAAIRAVSNSIAFARAIVGTLDNGLVVLPGEPVSTIRFAATADDATSITALRLARDLPAIAADDTGVQPGPPTTLERVTVLGAVHVKELTLASEVIFGGPVRADHRQAGCVRFSFVPDGSRTPQRYRCQPDLAVQTALDTAREAAGGSLSPAQEAVIRRPLLNRIKPTFTSTRYGDPAYAQLSVTCAPEISSGAEDGSEMGAFGFLKQAQRIANLHASLDEYLRVGLEAGIFFVT